MGSKDRPQQSCADRQRQGNKNEEAPSISRLLMPAADNSVDHSANRAHHDLAEHGRADAKLFQMIVAADSAHDPKERLRRNENTETIPENEERSRDVERPGQHEHGKGHGDSGNNAGEKTAKHCFESSHGNRDMVAQASNASIAGGVRLED